MDGAHMASKKSGEVDLSKWVTGLNEKNQSLSFRKGGYGEAIIDSLIREWFPHHHIAKVINDNTAHLIDRLLVPKPETPYVKPIFLEVKTKARRTFYNDSGMDEHNYWRLITYQSNNEPKVFVAFVDEGSGCIYGNFLESLNEPCKTVRYGEEIEYPRTEMAKASNGKLSITYFPMEKMSFRKKLPYEFIQRLRQMSERNYPYADEEKVCEDSIIVGS